MGNRHRKRRGQQRGTGSPNPEKDRDVHERKRGVKKMTIQDLAEELPTGDDLESYSKFVVAESDRGAAIMAAALVEKALEEVIRSYLGDPGGGVQDTWFKGALAPFRTFSAKIALGRGLAIYGEHMEARLTIIRNVRNAFAHRMIPLDFTHPTLVEECIKLAPDPEKHRDTSRKWIFASSCMSVAHVLGVHATERGGKELEVQFP